MMVEVVGGPMDGSVQEVPDGVTELHFVVPLDPHAFFDQMKGEQPDDVIRVDTIHLPIRKRRSDGKLVALWPYPQGEK